MSITETCGAVVEVGKQCLQKEHQKQMAGLGEGIRCKTLSSMWFSMAEVQGCIKKGQPR